MMKSIKTFCTFFLVAILFLLPSEKNSLAQEEDRADVSDMQIASKLESFMESHDFAKAEEFAREKNLEPRVIAAIMAYAGKKEESFAMFCDVVKSTAEEDKIEIARQCRDVLNNVSQKLGKDFSPNLGDEFFDLVVREGLLPQGQKMACEQMMLSIRAGDLGNAKTLFSQLLDSDYAEEDLVHAALSLIATMNSMDYKKKNPEKEEEIKTYLDKLLKKFPDEPNLRLQRTVSLATLNPLEALADLDAMKNDHPEFYAESESFIRLIRAEAFENLGEIDRAKSEYSMIVDSDFGAVAQDKINEYEAKEQREHELQEKLAESNRQQQHNITPPDIVPRSPHRFWTILTVNVIFLAVIAYLIYRRNRRRL